MSGSTARALAAGVTGAVALTATHELLRRSVPRPPRMDVLGMRGLARLQRFAGIRVPRDGTLRREALVGDLLANAGYYALVGAGRPRVAWMRGAALGLLAGAGALLLPRPLGLGDPPHADVPSTRLLTVAVYLAGGLAAAATSTWLAGRRP
jgi:hypothetical protein